MPETRTPASDAPVIVWLRQDLRLADNPALAAAIATKRPIILLYLLDDETPGAWRLGGASRWWLYKSLDALSSDIAKRGGMLVLRRGAAVKVLPKLIKQTGAAAIHWNRCYEPYAVKRDTELKQKLGIEVQSFNGALLFEPFAVKTKSGEPYKVFTPFWRACVQSGVGRTLAAAPKKLRAYEDELKSDALGAWNLLPTKPNWAKDFEPEWTPGEAGAKQALADFIDDKLAAYPAARDQLGAHGTSRLSPHLHFGEISPAQIVAAVESAVHHKPALRGAADKFLSEIGWREFSHHLLFHWPAIPEANWRDAFDAFPWRKDEAAFKAWTRGQTGYPVIDAAMRELWTTGYMHNRARMIAASFLIKHLLIDWRRGEAWFWDTLVDADLANNAASWQWVAGSGADASPYFRIFNPITQGEKFDATGAYVRRWVPELAKLPDDVLHRPWDADQAVLSAAGVVLGRTYPAPIVDHSAARARALEAFASL
jgi:deoxyribodipyrimidine photo-lyase